MGDANNVGQQVQAKILQKYKVKEDKFGVIDEALDEYGEELVFEEEDDDGEDDSEEDKVQDGDDGQNLVENEEEGEQPENSAGLMSQGFTLEALIKSQYETAAARDKK